MKLTEPRAMAEIPESLREPFDYTESEWRQDLFKDVPLEEFLKNAHDYRVTMDAHKVE